MQSSGVPEEVSSFMQSFTDPEATASQNSPASTLSVSMFDEHLVICPPAHLDLEMTEVLVIAAASAVASGSTVMIDLDPDTASDELIARRPLGGVDARCVTGDGGPVGVLGAGFVRLTTRDGHWTIDLNHGRLCRSANVIDPHFVGPDAWTSIQALWVTPTYVTALTNDGTYLSTLSAWTVQQHPKHPVPT